MSDHKKNKQFSAKSAFQSVAQYVRENKLQSGALLTSLLLGTTALSTPLISTPIGASAVLGGAFFLLLQNTKTTVPNMLALGSKWGLSAMSLGLLIGAINTVPEMMVSLGSAFHGAIDLGVGNIVGSNIAHTLLILGATAAIAGVSKAKDLSWKFNSYVMAGTTALFGSQLIYGTLSPIVGLAMLASGGYYIKDRLFSGQKNDHDHHHDHDHDHEEEIGTCLFHDHDDDEDIQKAKERPRWLNTVLAGGGMLCLVTDSDLIVRSGVSLANDFNMSSFGLTEAAIGTVIVAIGTSLPELSINLKAIKNKHSDLAIGNVLGCSITNTLIAGGVISLTGAPVPEAFNPSTAMGMVNTSVFMGSAALLTATLLATKGAMTRWMGGLALAGYAAYITSALMLGDGKAPEIHQHGKIESPALTMTTVHSKPKFSQLAYLP